MNCASADSPQGAKFCSNCGFRLNITDDDDVPMAPAVPVADGTFPIPSYVSSSEGGAPIEEVQVPHHPERSRLGFDPFVASAITMPPLEEAMASAVYWKNPSQAMLESANTKHMGGVLIIQTPDLKGKFTVAKQIHVGQILQGCKIDLSVADFVYPVTTIMAGAILGSLSVTVPRGVRVECQGVGILGTFGSLKGGQTVHVGQIEDSPLLVIKGAAILASVSVKLNEYVPPIRVVP